MEKLKKGDKVRTTEQLEGIIWEETKKGYYYVYFPKSGHTIEYPVPCLHKLDPFDIVTYYSNL